MTIYAETTERPKLAPSRRWWGLLALIVLLAAIPRFMTYDFSLPYAEHIDEPAYYIGAAVWRGILEDDAYYEAVPPGYLCLQAVTQPWLEKMGIVGLPATLAVFRFFSCVLNLLTLVFIALTGRLAGGARAGWIAGIFWGLSPLVIQNGIYALPDPAVYLFEALALWLASVALLHPQRRHWCIWSVGVGLLAVVMKYPVLPVLLPGSLAALAVARQDVRRGLRYLAAQAVLIGGVGFWLVFIYGVDFNHLQREGAVVQEHGVANMLNPVRVLHNIAASFAPLMPWLTGLLLALGGMALLYAWHNNLPRVKLGVAGLVLSQLVFIPWLVSSYCRVGTHVIRYVLPATVTLCVLVGMSAAQIVHIIPQRRRQAGWFGVSVLFLVPFLAWQLPRVSAFVEDYTRPDQRVDIMQWADVTLRSGPYIGLIDYHKIFNHAWGGYQGETEFALHETKNLLDRPIDAWRAQGVQYALMHYDSYVLWRQTPALWQQYGSEVIVLKTFPPTPKKRGPATVVLRIYPMQHDLDVNFGDVVQLLGYDLSTTQAAPGGELYVAYLWRAPWGAPSDDYTVYNHLVPVDSRAVLAQQDGAPLFSPRRPTSTWDDPEERLVGRSFRITIDESTPPGEYRLIMGLYATDGARLPVLGSPDAEAGVDYTTIALITITTGD